jgi:hypothetical protein
MGHGGTDPIISALKHDYHHQPSKVKVSKPKQVHRRPYAVLRSLRPRVRPIYRHRAIDDQEGDKRDADRLYVRPDGLGHEAAQSVRPQTGRPGLGRRRAGGLEVLQFDAG